jgi:hypothetical protein
MAAGTETGFASPSKTHAGSRGPALPTIRGSLALWDSSHGVRPESPLHRYEYAASTPSRTPKSPAFGMELPGSMLVPPLSFHPTSTVSSAAYRAGLLHPAAGHGVRQVLGQPWPAPESACRRCPSSLAPTLRSFSLPGSLPALPRFVPSRRCCCRAPPGRVATAGPCSTASRPQGFAPPESPLRGPGVAA